MAYVTNGSSNTVTNGGKLNLEVKLTPDSVDKILLKGKFTIENLDKIAVGDSLKNMTCVLLGQTSDDGTQPTTPTNICTLPYDDNDPSKRQFILPRPDPDEDQVEYAYLLLRIKSDKCTITPPSTILNITFKDSNDASAVMPIPFTVKVLEEKLEISSFVANPPILQGSGKSTNLSWSIKGNNYSYRIVKGLEEITSGNETGNSTGSINTSALSLGNYFYTLEIQRTGEEAVTSTIPVRVLATSQFVLENSPDGPNPTIPLTIANFCAGQGKEQEDERLFSVLLTSDDKNATIDSIGYSNEGFSGKWSKFVLTDEEKERLKPYITSPMIHLKVPGEVYGRLLFIGGSYVMPMETYNSVAVIDLDFIPGTGAESMLSINDNLPWSSRMGHSCVVFPHGNTDKIWILGGINKWGTALNDAWVSSDGKSWDPIISASMNWSSRCMAGVTVELDDAGNEKALWFGGGFSEYGGKEAPDIWKLENNSWNEIKYSTTEHKKYISSGLAFAGKGINFSTNIYIIGGHMDGELKSYFQYITDQNGNYALASGGGQFKPDNTVFTTPTKAVVITSYFKGCIWFMVMSNAGDDGVTFSALNYWIPKVTSKTLII